MLDISKNKVNKEVELETIQAEEIDLSNQKKINYENSGETIENIYSENIKEGKSLNLDRESQSKTQEYIAKSSPWINNYKSAKSKLESFTRTQSAKRRAKRSVAAPSLIKLSQSERTAIWEMYKLFEEMEKERDNLEPKLKDIDKTVALALQSRVRPTKTEIESKLTQIGWTSKEGIQYIRKSPPSRSFAPFAENRLLWPKWEENPYKLFLENQQIYQSLIDGVKKAQNEKYYQQRNELIDRSPFQALHRPSSRINQLSANESQAESNIALQVANRMLVWMNQKESL